MTTDDLLVSRRRAVTWAVNQALLGEVTSRLQTVMVQVTDSEVALRFAFADSTSVGPVNRRDASSTAESVRGRVAGSVPAEVSAEVVFVDPDVDRQRHRERFVDEGPRSVFLVFERASHGGGDHA